MKVKTIGVESANSFVKVYHDGKGIVYPNTVTMAVKENYKLSDNQVEDIVYEVAGQKVNVGRTIRYTTSATDSIKRYATKNYYIESIVALSHFANNGDQVVAVTGIPSNHYKDKEAAIKSIKENLEGTHILIRNGEKIEFTVREVLVTLQPLATFFYSVVDEWGNADNAMMERFENSESLVIDIGWGTTDIALLLGSGLVDQWDAPTSMKTAYEMIREALLSDNKGSKLASANIQLLDLENQIRTKGKFTYSNEEYETEAIYNNVMETVADRIFTEVNNIRGIDQYRTVIFTGGGTTALLNYITGKLTNLKTGKLEENIFIMNDTQMANAKGYYVYGKYIKGVK